MTFLTLLLMTMFVQCATSYNILVILPVPAKSHYRSFDALIVELSRRGHNVTIYHYYPKHEKIPNYTEIDTSMCATEELYTFSIEKVVDANLATLIYAMSTFVNYDRNILKCKPFKELLNSTEKYDLMITEIFTTTVFLGFADVFKIPLVVLSAHTVLPWFSWYVADIDNPSYIPVTFARAAFEDVKNPTFYERFQNTVYYTTLKWAFAFWFNRVDEIAAKEYFGPSIAPISEIASNTSLILTYTYFVTSGPRPHVPNVVEMGGINIKNPKPLEKQLKEFIESSPHGVIYFCMGSLLKGSSFPEEKRKAFVKAFSKIPQRVLWKYEEETLPGKPENVKILKWMPQRDILAHPNVKLFISHGGALGTNEAVYEGVPVLGIPIYADQRVNILTLKKYGAAESLKYKEISADTVYTKLQLMLNNSSYKENMRKLSAIYKNRPMSPMDTAIYWIEYVVRHKGAHHLRTAAVTMPWYQYYLLDVIAFILITALISIFILYKIAKCTVRYVANILWCNRCYINSRKKEN